MKGASVVGLSDELGREDKQLQEERPGGASAASGGLGHRAAPKEPDDGLRRQAVGVPRGGSGLGRAEWGCACRALEVGWSPMEEQRRLSEGEGLGAVGGFVDLDTFTGSKELAWFFGRALFS